MSEINGRDELSADTPIGKFRVRGYDLISLVIICALVGIGYISWEHSRHADRNADAMTEIVKETARTLEKTNAISQENARDTSRAIREMTCVIAMDLPKRMDQISRDDSFCKRISR